MLPVLSATLICLGLVGSMASAREDPSGGFDTAVPALPDSFQQELDTADQADELLERLSWGTDTVTPILVATQQLETRRRLLGDAHPDVAASLAALGTAYHRAGMYAQAEALLRLALERRRALLPPEHPDIAASLTRLGILLKDLGRDHHDEARRCQLEALAILHRTHAPDDLECAAPLQALGHLERRAGHVAAAESLLTRALEIHRRHLGPTHPEVGGDLLWLGWFFMRLDRFDAARSCLQESMRICQSAGLEDKVSEARNYLAHLLVLEGDVDRAAALVLEDWQASPAPIGRPGLGLARLASKRGAMAADLLLHAGRPQAAWEVFAVASGWSSRLYTCLSRLEQQPEHAALREARRAVDRLRGAGVHSDEERLVAHLAEMARLIALEQEAIRACPCTPAEVSDLSSIQAGLASDQAILGWMEAEWAPHHGRRRDAHWGYVIRATGPVHWVHLTTVTTLDAEVQWNRSREQLVRSLHRASVWPHRVDDDAALHELAQRVAAAWFQPLQVHLAGVARLLVVLDASNDLPPVECLFDAQGIPLLDRYRISYLPAATVVADFDSSSALPVPPAARRALVVGDPLFDPAAPESAEDDARNVQVEATLVEDDMDWVHNAVLGPTTLRNALQGDASTLRSLPRLPYSRREALRVAACFRDAMLLLGRQPTEERLRDWSESEGMRFDYVHFATHALIDVQKPERSAIVLSASPPQDSGPFEDSLFVARPEDWPDDGLLTMQEIYQGWHLKADLVTLSGCQTGLARSSAGGYLGISQAFLRAGARSLLVSQWKVDDVATALLMARFYETLTAGGEADVAAPSKAQALCEAKQWLRSWTDATGRRPFAHPAYWAGFVLVGDPR